MRFVMNPDMVYQYPIWAVGLLLVGAAVFGAGLLELCAAGSRPKAADVLKASCRAEDVLTPTTRLAAIEKRLEGLVEAIEAVQGPLERFYGASGLALVK